MTSKSKYVERTKKGLLMLAVSCGLATISLLLLVQAISLRDGNIVLFASIPFIVAFLLQIAGWITFVRGRQGLGPRHARTAGLSLGTFFVVYGGALALIFLTALTSEFKLPTTFSDPVSLTLLSLVALFGLPYFLAMYNILDGGGRAIALSALVIGVVTTLLIGREPASLTSAVYAAGGIPNPASLSIGIGRALGQTFYLILLIAFLWTVVFVVAARRVSSGMVFVKRARPVVAMGGDVELASMNGPSSMNSGLKCSMCNSPLPVGVAHCPSCGADPWVTPLRVESGPQ